MASDIFSVLQEQQLRTLKRSVTFSETQEKRTSNRSKQVTSIVQGHVHGGEHLDEYNLRNIYARELETYSRKPQYGYAMQEFTPRGLSLWKRVAKAWRTSGVSQELFIKAQFTFFHKSFGRAPEVKDLTTANAVVRAASIQPERVGTNDIAHKPELSELFKCCEKQLSDLMRAQKLSREEVYLRLVQPGILSFPKVFLNADPVWRALAKQPNV